MNILAIETASEACSVALRTGETCLHRFALAPRGHAERLLPWVQETLEEAGVALSALDAIAFSRGPGSFTSLRIGISVVQGLAWGASLPVVPLSSLRVTAQAAAAAGVTKALVAMDARMGEVFCGLFEADGAGIMRRVGDERVCAPEEAALLAAAGYCGVGNGFERYAELAACEPRLDGLKTNIWPEALQMLPLADDWLQRHQPLAAKDAQPVYLRDNVAQKAATD